MPRFTEKSMVEGYLVSEMQRRGWQFIASEDLEREGLEEPLLISALVSTLRRLNAGIGVGDEEIRQVVNELKLQSSSSEGCKQVLNYFKYGVPIKFDRERVVKYVRLFDYDNIDNNEFVISRQVIHKSGDNEIVNDIILYTNGIPLVDIECKNPAGMTETWYDAYRQMKDYGRRVPELFKYLQVGVAVEIIARYFPIVPRQEETMTHAWREVGKDGIDSMIDMLTPTILLSLVKDYIFFRIERGSATKVITRYMQYRATEQICNRVLGNLEGRESKTNGLVWHWQGSGKTLAMIFAANKLHRDKKLENPTIFFVVDRLELQTQLNDEFTALDLVKPEIVDSIDALRKILRHEGGRGKRGIFIALIQKFRPEELEQLQGELESQSKAGETILDRRNVIVFIDEAHRTQYGTLAGQMRLLLKKAFFFAFTGTPISKAGRDTYREFSYPPDEHYLDKYFITDSIEDGFTVKICYQPRLEKDVHLNRELLDSFIQSEFEELPEEYRGRVEEKVRRKLNEIKVFLENTKRIGLVAKDVAEHFKENVDGKFKALIVAVDRLACIRYKRELDKLLPNEYSEIVMSFEQTDPQEILDYRRDLVARHSGKETNGIIKGIIDKYKEDEYPKILIVTEMLLTGFDVPILQTMYLDKPLKEHRLLQAIARTNRPYRDVKEAGLIIDYVGILKELTKAFANYTKDDVKGVLLNLDQMREEFSQVLDQTLKLFEDVPKDRADRQTMLNAVEVVTRNEQNSKKFLENYKHLRKLFELLGPDVVKVQRLSEYVWVTQVYAYYLRLLRMDEAEETNYVSKYFDKTVKYVHESTELGDIDKTLPLVAFDEKYLKNLEEKIKTTKEKAANIVFALNRFVLVEKERNPIYESLVEKVERILRLWKEKTKDFENIYRQGTEIFEEIGRLRARQKELGFGDFEYSVFLTLEKKLGASKHLIENVRELTGHLRPQMFRGWYYQQTARKSIERDVRRHMRRYVKEYGIGLPELEELYNRIMESLRQYGQES